MTVEIDSKYAQVAGLRRQIRMAERRLGMINFELTKRADPRSPRRPTHWSRQIAQAETKLKGKA